MMRTSHIVGLAVAYTAIVALGVSLADLSGFVVFGVAYAWFAVGRMVGHSDTRPARKWGRQS